MCKLLFICTAHRPSPPELYRIMDFFPTSKRSNDHFVEHCKAAGNLDEFMVFQNGQISNEVKVQLSTEISEMISTNTPHTEIIKRMREVSPRIGLTKVELATTAWECIMGVVDWSKKPDLIAEQSLRHIKLHCALLKPFTDGSQASQEGLMNTIQVFLLPT